MECNFEPCRKPSDDQFTCDSCYIPKYCSEICQNNDKETHEKWCSPRTFVLKDFVPTKSKKLLDIGTYGEVQMVKNMSNHRFYAMKVIRKALVNDVIPLKVLFREIMIHKKLVHPNIVRLIDHFEDTTRLYIILELVEKGSLFGLLRQKIKLSEREACEILTQVCVGLNYLHENEIIHRDIKPENLLISKEEVIKICDFGWSASGSSQKLTFCGTLDYMSPEMLNSQPHTSKLDIWSLGILLYEMLHGTPPFRGKNPKEQSRLISSANYTIGPHISKSASQLLRSLLQQAPESRPSLKEILQSPWVQQFSDPKLKLDWRVSDLVNGEGLITYIKGKTATINFKGTQIIMFEAEIFRKCVIYDENNQLLSAPQAEQNFTRQDTITTNVVVNSLFKHLGIDSGRATPISGKATPAGGSANHSRSNSRKSALLASPNPDMRGMRRDSEDVSPPANRPPRASRLLEETKRSHPIIPKQREVPNYRDINLSPGPNMFSPQSKPKSSFLARFSGAG